MKLGTLLANHRSHLRNVAFPPCILYYISWTTHDGCDENVMYTPMFWSNLLVKSQGFAKRLLLTDELVWIMFGSGDMIHMVYFFMIQTHTFWTV